MLHLKWVTCWWIYFAEAEESRPQGAGGTGRWIAQKCCDDSDSVQVSVLKALPVSVVVLEKITMGCCLQNWANEQKRVEKRIQKQCSCVGCTAAALGNKKAVAHALPLVQNSSGLMCTAATLPWDPPRNTGHVSCTLYVFVQCTKYWVSSRKIILSNSCTEHPLILPLPWAFSVSSSISFTTFQWIVKCMANSWGRWYKIKCNEPSKWLGSPNCSDNTSSGIRVSNNNRMEMLLSRAR